MDINFHLPDFLKHFRLIMLIQQSLETHPEWFCDGVKIGSVYGAFPPAVWNGGRGSFGAVDERTVKAVLDAFNSKGIPCRFTFTNPLITEKMLGDSFCNRLMRIADNGLNEVIVFSPLLESYIRENYPKYKMTSSTCKEIRGAEELAAELEKDYKLVVLDYNWNNDFEFLEKLPHKEKAELLVNACCTPACPRRGEHYRQIASEQMRCAEYMKTPAAARQPFRPKDFDCPNQRLNLYETVGFSTHITPEALYGRYVPMGFGEFKIEGRTVPDINVLEACVYYMIKPEYKDLARLSLLSKLTQKVKYFM